MDILINPSDYDSEEMEDIVATFYLLIDELVDEEGIDRMQAITGMAIALRMLVEEHMEPNTVH